MRAHFHKAFAIVKTTLINLFLYEGKFSSYLFAGGFLEIVIFPEYN